MRLIFREDLAVVKTLLGDDFPETAPELALLKYPLNLRLLSASEIIPDLIDCVSRICCKQEPTILCTCSQRQRGVLILLSQMAAIETPDYLPVSYYRKVNEIMIKFPDCVIEAVRFVAQLTLYETAQKDAIHAGIHHTLARIASRGIPLEAADEALHILTSIVCTSLHAMDKRVYSKIGKLDLFSAFVNVVRKWLVREFLEWNVNYGGPDSNLIRTIQPSGLMEAALWPPERLLRHHTRLLKSWTRLVTTFVQGDNNFTYATKQKDDFYEAMQLIVVYGDESSVEVIILRLHYLASGLNQDVGARIVNANLIKRILQRYPIVTLLNRCTGVLYAQVARHILELILYVLQSLPNRYDATLYRRNVVKDLISHKFHQPSDLPQPHELRGIQRDIAAEISRLQSEWC